MQEKLFMIAAGDPGAPELPDIVTAYPKTAVILREQGLLAPLDEQFTAKELDAYLPQFIKEGRLSDGKLYVFPIAKSTEVLFVNQTSFDRFSAATGVSLDSLATFEGIAEAAVKYYEWTDSLTPDLPNDGKTFFTADSWFNIAQVGTAQLGGEFVFRDRLNVAADLYRRIWDFSVLPALTGGYAVTDGYSSDISKTGEIVCSIGSTAGILFTATVLRILTIPLNLSPIVSCLTRFSGRAENRHPARRGHVRQAFNTPRKSMPPHCL